MSLLHDEMRSTYRAQRGISQGAGITLVSRSGGYGASFECATRCSQILGNRSFQDYGEKPESIPVFTIPTEELHRSIMKLSETFSVALVDLASDETGSRFVLIWKILSRAESLAVFAGEATPVVADANQGELDLDEY